MAMWRSLADHPTSGARKAVRNAAGGAAASSTALWAARGVADASAAALNSFFCLFVCRTRESMTWALQQHRQKKEE
jgi:hypothetical protein